ncbi:MAG TPA: hypothetical protein DCY42_01140 [Chloroflexi bacterium]|nr:hypothetical protein [Chloroflexota bacterium]
MDNATKFVDNLHFSVERCGKSAAYMWDKCGILWDIQLLFTTILFYCKVNQSGVNLDNFSLIFHQNRFLRYNDYLEFLEHKL